MSTSSLFSQPGWKTGIFNGNKYRYFAHKASASDKPTFLLIHGFPSGPFTFRTLLPLLQSKGYGIVMPELIGYGETEKETSKLDKFQRKSITDDLVAILDAEGVDKVISFGHDHGSPVASGFVRFHSNRSIGLILASVSYNPPNPGGANMDLVHAQLEPILGYKNFGYWETFLAPHGAKLIEDHLDSFISIMYAKEPELWQTHFCPPGALEKYLLQDFKTDYAPWATPEIQAELREYLSITGLAGPLAWYHAATSPTLNFEAETNAPTTRITVPYLFFPTNKDKACPPILSARQAEWCDDLTVKPFDEGHWVIEANPEGVFNAIEEWVAAKGL